MTLWLSIILVIYLLIILGVSIYASKQIKTKEDFIVAGRRLPLWMAWATLYATWFGAATILGAAATAREEGVIGTIVDPFGAGMALIVAGLFFARKLWDMKLLTMGDFYGRIYGKKAELIASCVLVPGYFGWIGAQFVGLGELLEHFFHFPHEWAILAGASVILVYTMTGGMWSVTLTDALQLTVLLTGLVILSGTVFSKLGDGSVLGGVQVLFEKTEPEFLTLLPEFTVVASLAWFASFSSGCFGCVPGQDLMQRVFAAKDALTAKRACILAGILYISLGLLPIGMGLASRILVPDAGDTAIMGILAEQFLNPALMILFMVSLISMIISTATSAVLAPATILGHNLLGRLPFFHDRGLFSERFAVAIIVIGGILFAFSGETILGLLEMSLSMILVGLFVPLLMGLYGKPKSEFSGILAILFGSSVWLLRELMEGVFLPMPLDAVNAGMHYSEFLRHSKYGNLLFSFAVVPSAVSGVLASFIGYCVGQNTKLVNSIFAKVILALVVNQREGETQL
jgi:SSS family solute:Na+ symporter